MKERLKEIKKFIQNKNYDPIKDIVAGMNFSGLQEWREFFVKSIVESNFDSKVAKIVFEKICDSQNSEEVKEVIDSRNEAGITVLALMFLCCDKDSKLLEKAIEYSPDLSLRSNLPNLVDSISIKKLSRLLLDTYGIDKLASFDREEVNQEIGMPILQLVTHFKKEEVAELLLDKGANDNIEDTSSLDPLYDVAKAGNLNGNTLLHLAILYGTKEEVKRLLDNGAEVKAQNAYGDTPLHLASKTGNVEIITLLLDNGVDVNAENKYRKSVPLHLAAEKGHADCEMSY